MTPGRAFAEHFRSHVGPRLAQAAKQQALRLVLGDVAFSEAYREVWDMALRRGALHLPVAVQLDLEDWIATTLLTEVDRFQAIADEPIADPIAHYEGLARGDELLRWTFAAIDPLYRAHLLAERRRGA